MVELNKGIVVHFFFILFIVLCGWRQNFGVNGARANENGIFSSVPFLVVRQTDRDAQYHSVHLTSGIRRPPPKFSRLSFVFSSHQDFFQAPSVSELLHEKNYNCRCFVEGSILNNYYFLPKVHLPDG